jgi:hypothetical protein
MRLAFKYSEEDCQPGYVIVARGDHIGDLSPEKQRAERAIRAADPRGRMRACSVYFFERRDIAEALLDETSDKHLFEAAIEDNDVLHRADLRIYDEIVEALEQSHPIDRLLEEFWSGVERSSPRIELAVARARVTRKLFDKTRVSSVRRTAHPAGGASLLSSRLRE